MKVYFPLIILIIVVIIRYMTYDDSENKAKLHEVEDTGFSKLSKSIKNESLKRIQRILPSPHSELLLGTLVGIDNLKLVPRYNDVLLRTGTIHVVVVSGFNISLVNNFVFRLLGTKYKYKNMIVALTASFIYALICGLEPPVIRAWIMGGISSWSHCVGRLLDGIRVLVVSALVMLLVNPLFIESLSFQLSFLATLSLMLYSPFFASVIGKITRKKLVLFEDLSTTLAAQVLVWPLISFTFGRVSIISPLVNSLILWTIPLITIMGAVLLALTFVSPLAASLFSGIVYIPLDIFVKTVTFFGNISWADTTFQLSSIHLFIYYGCSFLLVWVLKRWFSST